MGTARTDAPPRSFDPFRISLADHEVRRRWRPSAGGLGRLGGPRGSQIGWVVAADEVGVRAAGAGDPLGELLEGGRGREERGDRVWQLPGIIDDQTAG